ncbi:RHS repeat-associated core domain-containing protein [Pseudomonas sp. 148P]|uniref:RHS repeat-associated core domain-containing protein n=1 Tax=Pseudomonas ulcerans TaxID=3115852 RepID=A0ABU7HJA2_9PSED|nr:MULTISPECIES: RHS repeat-associated core domain-containing protein [unclassified Pseudomonas]MEE1921319.1 RHS repeat-associated core domain-containing protein [Pseudomonas sp. 147P]MEE1931602.1 RHS repeat-associated core domain-containing protein [Pseudomonas sp. 148P]
MYTPANPSASLTAQSDCRVLGPGVNRPGGLGFDGQFLESRTGHYLLGNGYRGYNPVLMRFNQPDSWSPFGSGGLNPYQYCLGDPVNHRDPTGHAAHGNSGSDDSSPWLWISVAIGVAALAVGIGVLGPKRTWLDAFSTQPRPISPPPPLPQGQTRQSVIVPNPSRPPVIPVSSPQLAGASPSTPPSASGAPPAGGGGPPVIGDLDFSLQQAVRNLDIDAFIQHSGTHGGGSAAQRALSNYLPFGGLKASGAKAPRILEKDFDSYLRTVKEQPQPDTQLIEFIKGVRPHIWKIRTGRMERHERNLLTRKPW